MGRKDSVALLEEAGLIQIEKQFVGKKPSTMVSLTALGREAIERHWQVLEQLHKSAAEMTSRVSNVQLNTIPGS